MLSTLRLVYERHSFARYEGLHRITHRGSSKGQLFGWFGWYRVSAALQAGKVTWQQFWEYLTLRDNSVYYINILILYIIYILLYTIIYWYPIWVGIIRRGRFFHALLVWGVRLKRADPAWARKECASPSMLPMESAASIDIVKQRKAIQTDVYMKFF